MEPSPLSDAEVVEVGGVQCVTTVQLSRSYKLPDWPDKPHSQTLRSASTNANKVQAIPLAGVAFLFARNSASSGRNERSNKRPPIIKTGDIDHNKTFDVMEIWSDAVEPLVKTRDPLITKETTMSRRGIHPLLRGLDRPKRVAAPDRPVPMSGLESAQRKRYLRSEAEEAENTRSILSHCSSR